MTTSYLDEKVAPKREDRLGACIAFGGTAQDLRRRWGAGCMQHNSRGFCQGSICQLLPGLAIVNTIPDSVVIVHGALGCGGGGHMFNASARARQMAAGEANPTGTRWISTNLTESDVVMGGEKKLEAAILEADEHYRPAALIVMASCVPGLIGDDIDSVTARLQPHVNARIVPIHCEGFKTKVMATAYDSVYHGIARHLLTEADVAQRGSDSDYRRRVNLMNVSSLGEPDETELSRLLGALGLETQIFPCWTHPEDFRRATQAALSISTCPTHDDYFLKFLDERHGVPFILRHMPIGIASTNAWLREVAAFFGAEEVAEEIIAQETAELESTLLPLRPLLAGKKAMLSAGEVRTLATAVLLQELGMEVVAVRPYHFDEFGAPALEALEACRPDVPVNVGAVQPFESVGLIRQTEPDVYLSHVSDNVWAAKLGVPTLPIYGGPNVFVGYEGVFDIARRLARVLRNPSFNRHIAAHSRLPYRSAWLDGSSPYRYITEPVDSLEPVAPGR